VIADYVLFRDKPGYKSHHSINCNTHGTNDLEDFQYVFFELPKFKKQEHELETNEDRWLYFLKYADRETQLPKVFQGTTIERAFETVDIGAWSESERYGYLNAVSAEADAQSRIDHAREEGREEGEKKSQLETAKLMISEGFGDDVILKMTKLSVDELETLKKQ
jgi:predicted transposase/invertase (TIGR01784 family)